MDEVKVGNGGQLVSKIRTMLNILKGAESDVYGAVRYIGPVRQGPEYNPGPKPPNANAECRWRVLSNHAEFTGVRTEWRTYEGDTKETTFWFYSDMSIVQLQAIASSLEEQVRGQASMTWAMQEQARKDAEIDGIVAKMVVDNFVF